MPRYTYSRIDSAAKEIRLLTILPGEFHEQIRTTVSTAILSPESIPQYEALSYTWGSEEAQTEIFIGTDVLNLRHNLNEALLHLRYQDRPRVLWIDAICVNQEDLEERSRQVERMSDIYKLAERVVVWLGPESNDSTLALEVLEMLSSRVKFDALTSNFALVEDESNPELADRFGTQPYDEGIGKSILHLVERDWFERLWIWQEISLANRTAILMCGYKILQWQHFRAAIFYLEWRAFDIFGDSNSFQEHEQTRSIRLPLVYHLANNKPQHSPLRRLTLQTKNSKCSDPRDRIYALLGIMEESLKIRPDYEKPVSQVYQDVVLQNISQLKDLDILRCCIMQDNPVAATVPDMPSWVPDWSKPEESSSSFDHSHAAGESSAEARLIGNGVLEVTGVHMCIVEQVHTLNIDLKASDTDAIALIQKLVPPSAKDTPYIGGGSLLEAYCRTLNGNNFSDRWLPELNNMLDFRPCLLSFTAFCSDEDHRDEELLNRSHLDLDATSGRYLDSFIQYAYGRTFFRTQEGYIGLAPRAIQAGDHVAIFLGCASPIILRPSNEKKNNDSNNNNETYRVVGESYIYGLADSVAFLGPLPTEFAKVSRYDEPSDNWWDAYLNRETGSAQIEDPRLGELPVGWKVRKHKEASAWNWYVRDGNNGEEGLRKGEDEDEDENEDEEHDWRDNGDLRWTVEALRRRGVRLRKFMLV